MTRMLECFALSTLMGCGLLTPAAETPAQRAGTAHFESAKIEWPEGELPAPPFEILMSVHLDRQERAAAKISVAIEREKGDALAVALAPYHGEDDSSGRLQGRALIDSVGSQVLSIREGEREVEQHRFTVARGLGFGGTEHVYMLHEEGAGIRNGTLTLHRWTGCDRDAAWITEWIGPGDRKPIVVQGRATDLRDTLWAMETATVPAELLGEPERGGRGPSLWHFGQTYAFPKGVSWSASPGTWEVHVYREGSPPFAGRFEVRRDGSGATADGPVTPIDIPVPSDMAARLARIPQLAPPERDAFSTPLAATAEELRAMVRSSDVVLARAKMNKIAYAHRNGSAISLGPDADNMSPEERYRALKKARDESSAEGAAAQLADVAKARALVPALKKQIDALGKPDWASGERPF